MVEHQIDRAAGAAERFHQRIIDDFDDLLAGFHGANNALTHRFFFDFGDKGFDDRQRHIGFQQRYADFTQGGIHVFVRQRTPSGERIKDTRQSFC